MFLDEFLVEMRVIKKIGGSLFIIIYFQFNGSGVRSLKPKGELSDSPPSIP